jgi:hypothetical protein
MSKPQQFVIGIRNLDKCEPDWYYVCGAVSPVANLSAAICAKEVLLDPDIETALIFRGQESTAFNYGLIKGLGFEQLKILERTTSYESVDMEAFEKIVTQNKIESIIGSLDKGDIQYLENLGVLDLTIVT